MRRAQAYLAFVENIPFYGFAVMCIDHPEVQALIGRVRDRRVITYGRSPQADVRLVDPRFENGETRFDVQMSDRRSGSSRLLEGLTLAMPGDHNALNATAAMAVAHELGIGDEQIRKGLEAFTGVKRRFTRTGAHNGVTVFDDYGHHPVEIAAVLKASREVTGGKVMAVVQPHRYTRLASLFDEFCTCFNDADAVIVAPVYPAGETPIPGVTHDALADGTAGARPSPGVQDRRAGDARARWLQASSPPATSWSASEPAPSLNGPMRFRGELAGEGQASVRQ